MARRLKLWIVLFSTLFILGMGLGCAAPATPTPTPTVAPKVTPAVTPTAEVASGIQPLKIKFASHYPIAYPTYQHAERFKALLAERSGGKIKVDHYPGAQLFSESDEIPALAKGAVHMVQMTSNTLASIKNKAWSVATFYSRYFKDHQAYLAFWEEPAGGGYLKAMLEKDGIKYLGYWYSGTNLPFVLANMKRPVKKLEDWKGLKLTGTPGKDWQIEAFGATALPLPVADRPTAIQTGLVDGVNVSHAAMISGGYYAWIKYLTPSWDQSENTGTTFVGANLAWWNGLNEPTRSMIVQAMEDSWRWIREVYIPENDGPVLKKVKDALGAGYYDIRKLDPEEYARWRRVYGAAEVALAKEVLPAEMLNLLEAKYKF